MDKKQIEDCVFYIRSKHGFHRLMEGFKEKYISLGHIGGSVKLSPLTEEEKSTLEGFLGKSFRYQKSATISAATMQKALNNSRFDMVTLEELLKAYFNDKLESKKQKQINKRKEYQNFYLNLMDAFTDTRSGSWLQGVLQNYGSEFRYLMLKYRESRSALEKLLKTTMKAGNLLPAFEYKKERLPVFAAKISGDPHYFDEGSAGNKLLTDIILFYMSERILISEHSHMRQGLYHNERKSELFYYAGLLKDDISNFTIAHGIRCRKENGEYHTGIDGYYQEKQPCYLSLLTLGEIISIWSENNVVYILENPAVFAEIATALPVEAALVCTNGQLRLSSLVLLDLFYQQGYQMYYAGDFDPEGLQIADKLKLRYGKQLSLWRYSKEDYHRAKSNNILSEQRLKKLHSINDTGFDFIKECLLSDQRAGYQEKLIPCYIVDIKEFSITH